jgi:hypothetical protein
MRLPNAHSSIHDAIMPLSATASSKTSAAPAARRNDHRNLGRPHNTLCLQFMRDAAKSTLVERWRAEINRVLEQLPKDFLSTTRNQFETTFAQTVALLSPEHLMNNEWAATHARRVVDRLGRLLELAWLVETASRHAEDDATVALLSSIVRCDLLLNADTFEYPMQNTPGQYAGPLIDEKAITPESLSL